MKNKLIVLKKNLRSLMEELEKAHHNALTTSNWRIKIVGILHSKNV